MIFRPQQIYLLRMTGRATLANGGGGGGHTESNQATNTTTSLKNEVSSVDSRSVASDHAIALGGNGNSVTQNTTNTDSSTKNYTSMSDSGNSYANSGNTSYSSSTSITTTDFGSVQASIDAMKATAKAAIGLSGDVAGDAIGALTHQSDNTLGLIGDLFQFAKSSSANSQGTAMEALGLANNATAQATKAATDDKKHMNYALIGGGVLLALLILKKK
jgi:hypothetical protein